MNMVAIGIDPAKNVFALHGIDQPGKAVLIMPKVVRRQLLAMVALLQPCRLRQSSDRLTVGSITTSSQLLPGPARSMTRKSQIRLSASSGWCQTPGA